MSTNRKKLYSASEIALAQKYIIKNNRYFTRKTAKRNTVQVRISDKWHNKIKEVSKSEDIMMSFLLDKICAYFFRHYK